MRPFPSTRRVLRQPKFVPMTQDEVDLCGWEELDVLLISGDAYVDHPSFGMVLLARLLIAQPLRAQRALLRGHRLVDRRPFPPHRHGLPHDGGGWKVAVNRE